MVYLVCLVVRIGSPTRRSRETRETRETHIVFPQTVRFEGQQGRVCKWLIFGGPCRGRTYGPLIKRCSVDQTQQAQEHVSKQKNKESE
jgi:hypothetical protein